jgi:hypothetical protein
VTVGQVFAIVVLRAKLLVRRVRGTARVVNMIGAALLALIGLAVSAGLAAGFGMMMQALIGTGQGSLRTGCAIFFYTCAFFGIALPLFRGAMDEGFDVAPFLVFPLSRTRLFALTTGAAFGGSEHLVYLPSLAAVAVVGVLLPGANVVAGAALLAMALAFNVVWGHLVTLLLGAVLRARRVKEILAFAAFTIVGIVSLAPLFMEQFLDDPGESAGGFVRALRPALSVATLLAPSLAAEGLAALHDPAGGAGRVLRSLLGLAMWNGAGLLLGYRIFVRHHVGNRSRLRKRARPDPRVARESTRPSLLSFDRDPLALLPPEVRAVAAKDLHYLMRSVVGRFNLFAAPLFVLFVTVLLEDKVQEPVLGIDPKRLLLFGTLLYAVMFSNNFVNNAFAWEGSGIGSYFTSPVTLRRVIAGKNVAGWLFNGVLYVLILATWSFVVGPPDPLTLVTSLLLFAASQLFFTSWGNVVSVVFPLPRKVSALANAPSQVAVLLSILALALMVLLIGPLLSLPELLGLRWLQPVALAVLLAILAAVHAFSLRVAADLLAERKDRFLETLKTPR